MEFKNLKEEILKRAKEANACTVEYRRAYLSNVFSELIQVVKDNFSFAVHNKVICPSLIESYKDQFNSNQVYCNVDVTEGFLLASGSATVRASGSATVRASGSATVEASGSATVEASGSATVRASDSAYISSYYTMECKLSDNAIYRIRERNIVRYVSDNINFEKIPAYEPDRKKTETN